MISAASISAQASKSTSKISVEDEKESRRDIRTIPWKDLWKILRMEGWTWDFGPSHLNYFYVPGFDYKQDKEAILGVHKFASEDAIRRHIKKEIRDGGAEAAAKWSMFYIAPVSSTSGGSSIRRMDSQQESQVVDDSSWTLITHRKRRESAPASVLPLLKDDNVDDDGVDGDSSSVKRKTSMKRRKSMDAKHNTSAVTEATTNDLSQELVMTQAQNYPSPAPSDTSRRGVSEYNRGSPLLSVSSSPSAVRFPKQNSLLSSVLHAATSSTSSSAKATKESVHIFEGITFIFSGIAEKQR